MYLYNISVIIEDSVHEPVLSWLKQQLFTNANQDLKLLKMLNSPHEGQTYCIQVVVEDEAAIETIRTAVVMPLQEHIAQHFQEKAFLFDSIMQYISHS